MLGMTKAGKTCIAQRLSDHSYWVDYYVATEEPEMNLTDLCNLQIDLWDGVDLRRKDICDAVLLKDDPVLLLVTDCTDESAFLEFQEIIGSEQWLSGAASEAVRKSSKKILVLSKMDIEKERKISRKNGINVADGLQARYVEYSAKTDKGITDLKKAIADVLKPPKAVEVIPSGEKS